MTPRKEYSGLQRLNYHYAAQRRIVLGTLTMTANLLEQWGYCEESYKIKSIKLEILDRLSTQYAADKKFISLKGIYMRSS